MKRLGVAFSIVFSAFSYAGGIDTGNGGNVVLCPGRITENPAFYNKLTVLDLLEGIDSGFTYEHLAKLRTLPLDDAFKEALRIFLKPQDIDISRYQTWFNDLNNEMIFSKMELPLRFYPSRAVINHNCNIRQAILQMQPRNGRSDAPVLFTSPNLWHVLSSDLQVALILHEYFLHAPELQNECEASSIRAILAYLLSDQAVESRKDSQLYLKNTRCHSWSNSVYHLFQSSWQVPSSR